MVRVPGTTWLHGTSWAYYSRKNARMKQESQTCSRPAEDWSGTRGCALQCSMMGKLTRYTTTPLEVFPGAPLLLPYHAPLSVHERIVAWNN